MPEFQRRVVTVLAPGFWGGDRPTDLELHEPPGAIFGGDLVRHVCLKLGG